MRKTILTGIKPTGTPHLGNYFAAIKPALEMAQDENFSSYFFLADYHALTTVQNAEELKANTLELASTWLACGLDPSKVLFYKQSSIPEIFELTCILNNVTPKGLMNRAHAYKAMVEKNQEAGEDIDANVNMGLYTYPILMSADILLFGTDLVPVGLDQKQHIEIARDIANYFNNKFGKVLNVPEEKISEKVAVIPGLDGRKMSKSYNNVIPLFCEENKLKKLINRIVTDSSDPSEPKPTDSFIFKLYELFANEQEIKEMKTRFENGIGWGEAKKCLFEKANEVISPMREKFNYYMSHPIEVNKILDEGSARAREIAKANLEKIKKAIGVN